MPYRDPDDRRTYDRERKRLERVGCPTPRPTVHPLPPGFRLKTAADIVALVEGQVTAVCAAELGALERARCLGYLASVALRAIETGDLAARVEAIEAMLKRRKDDDGKLHAA